MKKKCLWLLICILLTMVSFSVLPISEVKGNPSITYDSVNKIITVDNEDVSFSNIYDASETNGWGCVNRTTSSEGYQYDFGARIVLQNTATLTDKNVQVFFNSTAFGSYAFAITVNSGCNLTFGVLIDESKKITKEGVSLMLSNAPPTQYVIDAYSNTYVYLYSSYLKGAHKYSMVRLQGSSRLYETTLDLCYLTKGTTDIYRSTFKRGRTGLRETSGTFEDLVLYGTTDNVFYWIYGFGGNITNAVVRNVPSGTGDSCFFMQYVTVDRFFINVETPSWTVRWQNHSNPAYRPEMYRAYELSLTVTFPNGTAINGTQTGARAVIQHYGVDAGVDYNQTLGEDGTISTQTLVRGYWNGSNCPKQNGWYLGDETDMYDRAPFNLQIYNVTGYDTYSKNFTLNEKTSWEIALTVASEDGVPTDFNTLYYLFGNITLLPFALLLAIMIRKRREKDVS